MRPLIVGLHGRWLSVADVEADVGLMVHQGHRVWPESLFEEQLRARLGGVPGWLSSRASSFEAITRYSQIDVAAPVEGTVVTDGNPVSVKVRLHPKCDRRELALVQLHAARGHDLDVEELVAESSDQDVETLDWTPSATGAWRLRLVLVNSLAEESTSEPLYIFVQPLDATVAYAPAEGAWFQPRSLSPRGIAAASSDVVYSNAAQYRAEVRELEKPLVQAAVDDPERRLLARGLIDGDLLSNATGPASLRWFGVKGFVLDLGTQQRLHFVELVAPEGTVPGHDFFGALYVQVSDDPEAQYSYTNSDFAWRTVRRLGNAHTTVRIGFDADRQFRIYLPADTQGRFVRLVVRTLDSRGADHGNLSEIRCGAFTGM